MRAEAARVPEFAAQSGRVGDVRPQSVADRSRIERSEIRGITRSAAPPIPDVAALNLGCSATWPCPPQRRRWTWHDGLPRPKQRRGKRLCPPDAPVITYGPDELSPPCCAVLSHPGGHTPHCDRSHPDQCAALRLF